MLQQHYWQHFLLMASPCMLLTLLMRSLPPFLQVLGVGGFNSWRYNQPSLYFFDVGTNPAQPKFLKSVTPQKGAVADDLVRLPNGGFLVSLMGNKQGVSRT